MGLLDMLGFSSKGGNKDVAKNTARLTNQNMQHEDRLRAAELLYDAGTEDALVGLLKRYDMTLEKTYQDQDEKVFVRDLLVRKGADAIEPIRKFMAMSENVNWPERILSHILNDDAAVVTALLEVIESERDTGDMKGPKRAKLLNLLVKYEDERIAPAMIGFLKDFDETVRFTAVEVLDKQGHAGDLARLVEVMTGDEEESVRVRLRILDAIVRHGWEVGQWREQIERWLPEGFIFRGERLVEVGK